MTFQRLEFACAIILFAGIVLLVGAASVARYLGSPIIWSIEIAQLLFVWLVMFSADLALQQNRHFGLGLVLDNLPPPLRWWLEGFNMLVLIGLLGFLFYYSVLNAMLMHPRLVGATQFNASLIHASMPFGLALMLRTLGVQLWGHVRQGSAR